MNEMPSRSALEAGGGAQPVESHFELTKFLEGRTYAWGIFEDRFGRLRRKFSVEMNGRWQDGVFFLDEKFLYDTGEEETRTWQVTAPSSDSFTATCPDCVGTAVGHCDADSIRMSYRFRLTIQNRAFVVDFDDRIYRMGDGIAVNRARMSKWGIRLGELSLFFRKDGAFDTGEPPRVAA